MSDAVQAVPVAARLGPMKSHASMRAVVHSPGCIVYSDRRPQFRSPKLRRELALHNLVGSMRRAASYGDNAAKVLQKNVLNRSSWTTREDSRMR